MVLLHESKLIKKEEDDILNVRLVVIWNSQIVFLRVHCNKMKAKVDYLKFFKRWNTQIVWLLLPSSTFRFFTQVRSFHLSFKTGAID